MDIQTIRMILITVLMIFPFANADFYAEHIKCCPEGQILDLHSKNCMLDNIDHHEALVVNVTSLVDGKLVFEEEQLVFGEVPDYELYQCKQSLRYHSQFLGFKRRTTYALIDTNLKMISSSSCIDLALDTRTSEITIVAQGCLSCDEEEPCVNFCCPSGQLSKNGTCVEDAIGIRVLEGRKHKKVNLGLHCPYPIEYPKCLWDLNTKGEMEVDGSIYSASEYCIDVEGEDKQSLLLCQIEEPVKYKHIVKMVFMCLSMVSILVIILLHIYLEDLWTQHFTKLKIPFYLCLFLSFLVIVITSLKDFSGTSSCVIWALLIQYFSLAIFFWLTSMSLDIWLAFRVMANPVQDIEKKEAQLKSRTKCFYFLSFGSPMVITMVTGILQFAWDPAESTHIHPSIGVSCMLGQYLPQLLYFHLIILILLALNGVFYCLMVFKFTCGIWKEDSFSKTQMRNFKVFLELFFLMGINWISESIVFFVGWLDKENWDNVLLVFISSINWLIGIFILLLFCSKSNNRDLVRNLFCQYREDPEYYNLARTFSTQLSENDETFRVLEAKN